MGKAEQAVTTAEVIRRRRMAAAVNQGYIGLLVKCVMLTAALVILLTQVFLLCQVSGNEMFPAVKDGDLLLSYRLQRNLAKNDVVVYEVGGQKKAGRILGRPGDVIMLDDTGALLVNGTSQGGEILYPTYAKEGWTYPYMVPEDAYFILGDYRTQSTDSRDFGPVDAGQVKGKVITIFRRRGI